MTLAGLRLAAENSKPHDYKQMYKKNKDLSKTWVVTGEQFENFRLKKEQKQILDFSKTPSGTDGP